MDTNTTIDQLFPSKWLKSSDLGSKPRTVTITKIEFELIGVDKERKAVVSFQETPKRLILNRSNAQTLANLYGPIVSGWYGKRITLFPAEVLFRGLPTQAIRIKEEVPESAKANNRPVAPAVPENEEPPIPEEMPW